MATLKVAIDAREAKTGAAEFQAASNRVSTSAKDASDSVGKMQGRIDSVAPAAEKMKVAVAAAGASMTAAFALNAARQTIGQYEQTLANLRAATGATKAEMESFDATAREIGSGATVYTTDEAAQGLLNLAKAGFTAEQAIGSLPAALDLATAGDVSLAEATDTVAATLAQFRLSIGDSAKVSNALVVASNASMASVQGVAEAMKYAGPLASALGVSMEDTAAAISVLSNAGIQGSLAGTNLRGILASLINPSREAEDVLKQVGLTTSDVDVRTHGLVGALGALKAAGAGPAELETIFGKLNVSAAIALGSMTEDFTKIQTQIREGTTAARDQAAIMGDTLPGSFKKLRATIDAVFIKLGRGGLGSAMRDAVDFARDLIATLFGIDSGGRRVSATVERVAIAIKAAGAGVATFVALQAAQKFYEFGTAVLFSGNAFAKLNVLMAKNPIGLLAVAVALAVAAFLEFKDEVIKVGDEFTTFGDIVAATWEFFRETTVGAWKGFTETAAGAWKWFSDGFLKLTQWLGDRWASIGEAMGVDWSKVIEGVLGVLKRGANVIIGTFVALAKIVGTIVDTVVKAAKAVGDFDFSKPGESLSALGDALSPKRIFEDAKGKLAEAYAEDYVGAIVGSLAAAFSRAAPGVKNAVEIVAFAVEESQKEIVRRAVARTTAKKDEVDRLAKLKEEAEKARNAMQGLGRTAADTGEGLNKVAEGADEASQKIKQLRDEIADEIAALEREVALRHLSSEEFEREIALADFRARAKKAEIEDVDELSRRYAELSAAAKNAAAAREERARVGEQFEDMRNEIELMRLTNEEREVESGMIALSRATKHLDAEETRRLAQEYRALVKEMQEARAIRAVSDEIASSFGKAFSDVVLDARSMGDALFGIFREIQSALLQAIVVRPFVNAISGGLQSAFGFAGAGSLFTSSRGNVFEGGRLRRYADGGHITGGPEYFPLAGGDVGLRGEAGREAVLPLKRLGNGDLGVQTDGGGRGSTTVVHMTVYAKDADSFRKSTRQIASDLRRATGGGVSQ